MDKQYYLFAGDDIYDEEKIIYLKDELIGSMSILKKTKDIKNILPKGTYYIREDKEMYNHEIYIEERLENWQYFENILMKKKNITINLKVIDKQSKDIIEGVHCGIFAFEDIYDQNHCLVYFKNDLIMDVYSSINKPIKVPLLNINEGTFYIQQLNSLEGYYGNTELFPITLTPHIYKDFSIVIENEPTIVEISKKDYNNDFVEGAWLILYDEKGQIVDEWISEKEHIVYNLSIGHRYIVEEKKVPKGYKSIGDTSFFVENKRAVQKILIRNDKEVSS